MKRHVYSMMVAAVLIAVLAGTARASGEFNRPGPYLGIGPSGGLTNFSGVFQGFGNSYGFNFHGGYRFNDYVAIEGLYEYMDDFGASRTSFNLQGRPRRKSKRTTLPFQPSSSSPLWEYLSSSPS